MKEPSNSQAENHLRYKSDPVMISACLLGVPCRYDGRHSSCPHLMDFLGSIRFIPFCPEQMGGLPTPRSPADIKGGDGHDVLSGNARIINTDGKDVTKAFINGAQAALRLAGLAGSSIALMKDKSPSCGFRTPYCEKPSGLGIGVAAALFESSGMKIFELGSQDVFPTHEFLELLR